MARPLRFEFPDACYYTVSRGNEGRAVFLDDEDRLRFLECLRDAAGHWDWSVLAYALTNKECHLLIKAHSGALSEPMRHINGRYTQYFNRRHGQTGHLFRGRFKSLVVEEQVHLRAMSRYVHQRPAESLSELALPGLALYPWSSYRAYLGLDAEPPWMDLSLVMDRMGAGGEDRAPIYRSFTEAEREASPWKKALSQLALGSEKFIEAVLKKAQPSGIGDGRLRKLETLRYVPSEIVIRDVCLEFGVTAESIIGGRYRRENVRPAAMRLLKDMSRLTLQEISKMFSLTPAAVSLSLKRFSAKLEVDRELRGAMVVLSGRLFKKLNLEDRPQKGQEAMERRGDGKNDEASGSSGHRVIGSSSGWAGRAGGAMERVVSRVDDIFFWN